VRHSAVSALMSAALLISAFVGLNAEGSAPAASPSAANETRPEPKSATTWILGIAQFSQGDVGSTSTILLSTLPRLIVADLQSLPIRRAPPEEAAEIDKMKKARARFTAGTELATKLDERSVGFLNPMTAGAEKSFGIYSADKAVKESYKNLTEILKEENTERPQIAAGTDLTVRLWTGHATGKLIDTPGANLAKAAKAADVDFLVSGTVSIMESGYASIVLRGYDVALDREVLYMKSHCAVDDPEPTAREMADRLERWCAGRDFTRIEVFPTPAASELFVNGMALSGSSRVAYVYEPGLVHISANAPGYKSGSTEIAVGLGERRSVELKLESKVAGSVTLTTDPANASVNLDSVPLGTTPQTIELDGSRKVLSVSAEGMEPETVVLPASGESNMNIELKPSDGIGPAGRIAKAKDDFYWSLGWFAVSVPITTLTLGIYNGYDEAYQRSGSPSLAYSRWNASRALAVACTLSVTTAVFMVIRLVKYLKTAR
jgi:PEGA domain